jgi:hypothetical protein
MRGQAFAGLLAAMPVGALACELPGVPADWRDPPIAVARDCSFREAGDRYGYNITAGPAVDVGGGLVAQGWDIGEGCGVAERVVVVDCATGEGIGVEGEPWDNGLQGGRSVTALYPPEGKLALHAGTSIAELAAISAREGYDHWTDLSARITAIRAQNRPDPYCGCRLFYPDSAAAQQ